MTDTAIARGPAWCDVEHDPTQVAQGNYHHDGAAVSIVLDQASTSAGSTTSVHVKPALFVPGAEDDRDYVPQIEIQTNTQTVLELSLHDGMQLAAAILDIAARIDDDWRGHLEELDGQE